ncbi:MAG: CRISPR-associated protein Cas10 [Leptolyngbyaceae cyanobacterium SM1_3_5]|nr:CRISPR-associated protein Cas10 [Leptolyngbyaceae cyanobacterium SM1_3_5]
MPDARYTAVTFAPVQGFIEKSRKLRDLYGSSFILSYLSHAICLQAGDTVSGALRDRVISPAILNLTQGTPNYLIIRGEFQTEAKAALDTAWKRLANHCRCWIEAELNEFEYHWKRDWNLWIDHAWEFFSATGESIDQACQNLGAVKQSRDWTGINWTGESSTLSGADGIAWPGMNRIVSAKERSLKSDEVEIKEFYDALRQKLEGSIGKIEKENEAEIRQEYLSIPELIKRLTTYEQVTADLQVKVEIPESFKTLNRYEEDSWTGWFKGDGDRMGKYLSGLNEQERHAFSRAIMNWGKDFKKWLPKKKDAKAIDREGRVIYAGGDDFLGVLYREPPRSAETTQKELTASECVDWLQQFPQFWQQHRQPITVSVGFVWAAPKVPQRDVLQHCNEAESHAKKSGRDRIALRVLFNSGTYLEWTCPWRFLPVLQDYRDPQDGKQDWVHFYNDVAVLDSRHAFRGDQVEVAIALLNVYFDREHSTDSIWQESDRQEFYSLFNQSFDVEQNGWWNHDDEKKAGILGDRNLFLKDGNLDLKKVHQAVNDWISNLAKLGFHLCSNI